MGKIFATTSGKGGVGKSSIATGLGIAFAAMGKSVLLVDMDEGFRCLDLLLGVDDAAVLDLGDAFSAEELSDVAYNCKRKGLFLITAPTVAGTISPEKLHSFTKRATSFYDIVIFDFPAGHNPLLYNALPKRTLFLGVATPDPVSVRDMQRVGENLLEAGLKARLIINRFNYKEHKKRKLRDIDYIINTAALQLLGIVPEAEDINTLSVNHRLKKRGKSAKAFLRIAQRLLGKNVPLENLKKI